jgi:CO/xanthine dehydrogenase FAD-binding subunit
MKLVDFITPETVADACRSLRELSDQGIAAAGCTAYHFYTQDTEKTAVLLTGIGIEGIQDTGDAFRIGAATPLTALVRQQSKGWVLNRVARHVASHQIRNISTLGGNIARIFPWADLPVALLALGGSVQITDGTTERSIDIDDYLATRPEKLLSAGEILTAVTVSASGANHGFGHVKQRMKSEAFSLCTASAGITIDGDSMANARIALGAAIPFPSRIPSLEEALNGQSPAPVSPDQMAEHLGTLKFIKKEGMTPEYIAKLAATTLADAINEALKDAQGGEA